MPETLETIDTMAMLSKWQEMDRIFRECAKVLECTPGEVHNRVLKLLNDRYHLKREIAESFPSFHRDEEPF